MDQVTNVIIAWPDREYNMLQYKKKQTNRVLAAVTCSVHYSFVVTSVSWSCWTVISRIHGVPMSAVVSVWRHSQVYSSRRCDSLSFNSFFLLLLDLLLVFYCCSTVVQSNLLCPLGASTLKFTQTRALGQLKMPLTGERLHGDVILDDNHKPKQHLGNNYPKRALHWEISCV